MSIYFDFKTINELAGGNYYRQSKEFTLEELSQYNGSNGSSAYVAIEGIVYDISNYGDWGRGTHFGTIAGQDLTNQFNSCHGIMDILTKASKVGILREEDYMGNMDNTNHMNNMNFGYDMTMKRQVSQDKSKFTPDDWIRYITPLVVYALREPSQGMNTQILYQKVILMGVLVGLGKTPQEAIDQVRDWQNTGTSQILKSGASTIGGTGGSQGSGVGTFGGIGTGGTTGTGTGFGTGGSTGSGAGTSGGMGTGGSQGTGFGTGGSTGGGAGTFGGMGTGGSQGTGFGTGGTSAGSGMGRGATTRGNINKSDRLKFD